VRGFSLTAAGFTAETDWLLEGAGFEPSVPLSVLTVLGPSFVIDQVRAGRGYRFALDEARSWSGGVKVANLVLKE
jgi:hypothetical protein